MAPYLGFPTISKVTLNCTSFRLALGGQQGLCGISFSDEKGDGQAFSWLHKEDACHMLLSCTLAQHCQGLFPCGMLT